MCLNYIYFHLKKIKVEMLITREKYLQIIIRTMQALCIIIITLLCGDVWSS